MRASAQCMKALKTMCGKTHTNTPLSRSLQPNVLLLTQRFFDHIHDERQKSQNGRVPWSCFTKRAKFSVYPNTSSTCSLHSDRLPVAAMSSSFYEQRSLPSSSLQNSFPKPATLRRAFLSPMHLDTSFNFSCVSSPVHRLNPIIGVLAHRHPIFFH